MANEVIVFLYVKWTQYFLELHSSFRGKNRYWGIEKGTSGRSRKIGIDTPIAKDWAQHFVNWNERLICINDWYLFVFIYEKDLLSISSVLFIVHLHVINALKCHAGITQKYGVTSCRLCLAITCWIRFCHEWAFRQSLKTPQTSVNRGNITVSCVGVRELV